jgi:arginase
MNVQIIQVPYDSGHKSLRTGRGPEYLLQHGAGQVLSDGGSQVITTSVEAINPFLTEIGTAFDLNRALAGQVRAAVESSRFPVVLAGNCNSCLGTLAGLDPAGLGIVWLDAHGDFNTPDTTVSGFLDGMGLAMAAGRCWPALLKTIPGFQPIPETHILHIGARDLDPEEARLLAGSAVEVIRPGAGPILEPVEAALVRLREKAAGIYLHVDIDVLDTGDALPNQFAVPGGLAVDVVEEIVRKIKRRFELRAGAITSFNPDYDKNDQVVNAGIRILRAFMA